ncbi:MAG: M61 family metallopeptidase [Phycisphaeraceae bacterium]|nr:M61 family metallopeptidase [Phycisphaeraceae bacterium]
MRNSGVSLSFVAAWFVVICSAFSPMAWGRAEPGGRPLVEYIVEISKPQTQTIDITMVLRGGREVWGNELDVAMPVWRPGRYQILDLAGGIQAIEATDGKGTPLAMRKYDRATWRIASADATEVHVRYRLYCNSLGDRTRHVDATHAFLSGSAVFLYCPKMRHMPLKVTVNAPAHWRVACGLRSVEGEPHVLLAPDYDVLVDSPIEIGEIEMMSFESDGKPHEIAIWAQGAGGVSYDRERLKDDFKKIVDECIAIFGDTPYERYVFLIHIAPGAGGGTEHLNSTIMQTNPAVFDSARSYRGFLGLTAHEFFHTWNVKQLRPEGLVPYDYQRENYTDLLWVAEGTTSYYDDLIPARVGQIKESDYLDILNGQIGTYIDTPGSRVQSLEMSSFDSWIKFNRPSPDAPNSTVNFYTVGAVASFVLDMEIRRRTDNTQDLDEMMREMYRRYPLSNGGFSSADMVALIEEQTGLEWQPWFDAHIFGTEPMDIPGALAVVGLEQLHEPPKPDTETPKPARVREMRPYVGIRVADASGMARVSNVLTDGPAFEAGIVPGDEIIAINGVRVRASDFDSRVDLLELGTEARISLLRRDELMEFRFTPGERPAGTRKIKKVKDPSDAQQAAFDAWLKRPAKAKGDIEETGAEPAAKESE